MKNNNIISVLSTIQNYCKNREEECEGCPFCIDNKWAVNCMFCGPHVGEGVIPENWELNLLDRNKINDEI